MKLFAVVVALSATFAFAQQTPVVVAKEDTEARLERINELLSEAIGESKHSFSVKTKLEKAREEVRALKKSVSGAPTSDEVAKAGTASFEMMGNIMEMGREQMRADRQAQAETKVVVITQPAAAPAPPPAPSGPRSMSDDSFARLVGAMEEEGFEDTKLKVLSTAARKNHFSVRQATLILAQFDFSKGKLGAARTLKPRIVDPENQHELYAAFDFDSDKAELRAILGE